VVGIALKGFGEIGKSWQKVKGWFGMGEDEVAKAGTCYATGARYDIWRSGADTGSGQQSDYFHDQQRYQ